MPAAEIALGWLADLLLGDPAWLPHPVVGIGKAAERLEPRLRKAISNLRMAGAALVLLVAGGTWVLSWGAVALAARVHPWLGVTVSALLFFSALALRTLDKEARSVAAALKDNNLPEARRRVARIVGRDTGALDEAGVARAAVESVAESSVDGVTAPLFFAVLGGGPLALTYRAVNTLDSMVGHKDERYREFGWAAARLDDLLNFVPARLTGLLLVWASAFTKDDVVGAWRIFRRDRLGHASPNAGHPEAAVAGALGLRLCGPSVYQGETVDKPWMGDGAADAGAGHILRALRLVHLACLMALGLGLTVALNMP